MNMNFKRRLPIPKEIKEMYPLSEEGRQIKDANDRRIREIFTGESDKFLVIVGPCSADREDAVLEYMHRLRNLQEKIESRILIIPRLYTNKPRSTGAGYKGMLHQPDPNEKPDIFKGLVSIRKLHVKAINETGFSCADEMLYPENHRVLSDLLSYVAVGARSVENQQHRLTASGLDVPVGMKNPMGGDLVALINSIKAAQTSNSFIYRNWEVETSGNPLAHAILRGYSDVNGCMHPNYGYEDLLKLCELYESSSEASLNDCSLRNCNGQADSFMNLCSDSSFNAYSTSSHPLQTLLKNPAVIVDCNHANSGKQYLEQIRIAKDVLQSMKRGSRIAKLVKGLMIESYLEDGAQPADGCIYGKSITDPCLGWEKTERLLLEIADQLQ